LLSGNVLGESNFTGYQIVNQFIDKGNENGQLIVADSIKMEKAEIYT